MMRGEYLRLACFKVEGKGKVWCVHDDDDDDDEEEEEEEEDGEYI